MTAVYRCAECAAIAYLDESGTVAPSCECSAAIIASAVSTLTGKGGL